MINTNEYESQFEQILGGDMSNPPYDNDDFINYVKLNHARIKRWTKKGNISPELETVITNDNVPKEWVLITEPWCGDAAHIYPFIAKLAGLNSNIKLTIQNRDAEGSEIDNYLTNGSKAIPKLVIRNEQGEDLFTWGPRPKGAVDLMKNDKDFAELSPDEKKTALQKWYNKDKGVELQEELLELLKGN